MTARDWPKEPGQDLLVQRRKEESGVPPELAQALEKESLGLELEPEQELGEKQEEQERQPQGVGEELDMASEVEWLLLKVLVLLDRSLQCQA